MKTPAYYKNKPNDIDRSLLTNVPDAPRVPQPGLPTGYDWTMFGDDTNRQNNVMGNIFGKVWSGELILSHFSEQRTA